MTTTTGNEQAVAAMRDWLTDRVAYYLEREPEQILTDVPLTKYGLDSVYAMAVSGDIEEEYGLELDVTVMWDHPTVDTLADYLVDQLADSTVGSSS